MTTTQTLAAAFDAALDTNDQAHQEALTALMATRRAMLNELDRQEAMLNEKHEARRWELRQAARAADKAARGL